MKKLYVFICLVFVSGSVWSQAAKVVMTPADADPFTENVSLEFDLTGTTMEGETDAYLWSWATGANPSEMKICGHSWSTVLPSSKLTPVEGSPNKFILQLPITTTIDGEDVTYNNLAELFFITPGKLTEIGFLIRNFSITIQTDGDMATKVNLSPLVFIDSEFRSFPSKVSSSDVISIYLNKELTDDAKVKVMENITVDLDFKDAEGNSLITSEDNSTIIEEDGTISFTFLIDRLVDLVAADIAIENIKNVGVTFNGSIQDGAGQPVEIDADYSLELISLQ